MLLAGRRGKVTKDFIFSYFDIKIVNSYKHF